MDLDHCSKQRKERGAAGVSPARAVGPSRGAAAGGAEHIDPSSNTGQFCGLAALTSGLSQGLQGAGSWLLGRAAAAGTAEQRRETHQQQ